MTAAASNKLVMIGVSGLDWPGFVARVRRGALPRLAAFAARGASSSLVVPPPSHSLTSWATIASGVLPETHGVIRADEAWAGGIRPAGTASWRVPTVWERLEAAGISTASVGWPATSPGDTWAGLHVDNGYAAITGRDWNDWALPPHCVPARHREALRDLRTHPDEMRAEALLPLVPTLPKMSPTERTRLPELAAAMARTATEQAAMIWLLGREDWNTAFLHHGWLGAIRSRFENAAAPYDQAVEGAWRFLDGLAGLLIERAGNATVLLVSDGYRAPSGASPQWQAFGLGQLAEAMVERDMIGARAMASEALTLDPGSLPAMRALAAAAISLGDAEAIGQIAGALEEQVPELPWSKLARAAWHIMRGSTAEAAHLLVQAEKADDVETLLRVATAWLMLNRSRDARRVLEYVEDRVPELAATSIGLSMVALAERNHTDAEAHLHRLLEREPGHAAAYLQLAEVYSAQGRAAESDAARKAADRMRPAIIPP